MKWNAEKLVNVLLLMLAIVFVSLFVHAIYIENFIGYEMPEWQKPNMFERG